MPCSKCRVSLTLISLQSSDGVIFTVDEEIVNHMVTIKTMLDHEDEDSDEVIPVPSVNAAVLEKVIQCIDMMKTEKGINHCQCSQFRLQLRLDCHCSHYFHLELGIWNLEEIFEIIKAADYLDTKSLLDTARQHVLINHNDEWDIIEDATRMCPEVLHLLEDYNREHGYEVIVAMKDNRSLEYFDTMTETWTRLTDIPDGFSRHGCQICSVNGNIYLVGGNYDGRRVTEFNPRNKTWRNIAPMQTERYGGHNVCVLDHKMFVVGFMTCEMLDMREVNPRWRHIESMNNRHRYGDAVVFEKKIYVVGGISYESVEVYDPEQDQWENVANLLVGRTQPAAGVLQDKIFVSGGCNNQSEALKSVECYDPGTDTWSRVADMNIPRYGHSLVSLKGRLFAIGGWGGHGDEVYNPENDTWTVLHHKWDGVGEIETFLTFKYNLL